MAIWQYGLLAAAAALALYFSLLFSCRHSKNKLFTKRRHYRRFFDTDSSSDNMPMGNTQGDNEHLEPHGGESTLPNTDVNVPNSEPTFENEIQVTHNSNVPTSDLSSCVNTVEFDSVRTRSMLNIDRHSHNFLPLNNISVEAIFHPLPPSAQEQAFLNQTHDYSDGAKSAENYEGLLRQHADVTVPPITLQAPVSQGYVPPTVAHRTEAPPPSLALTHLPPTSVLSTPVPQTSSNEPGPLEYERYPPSGTGRDGFSGQQPRNKHNVGNVDDERAQHDSTSIDAENAHSRDSGQGKITFRLYQVYMY